MNPPAVELTERRHDLDGLRAVAMLLGIGLHAALSFMPGIWPVQDRFHNDTFSILFSAVHGFRMPLFFLVSGFFTAMLWQKRGLKALIHHRFKRIVLPLLLGCLTILPAMNAIIGMTMTSSADTAAAPGGEGSDRVIVADIWSAAARGDIEQLNRLIGEGMTVDAIQPASGSTPLMVAALYGQVEMVEHLLAAGADIAKQGNDGSTALHSAVFFGRAEVVEVLLDRGADPTLHNMYQQTPMDTLNVDWGTTVLVAKLTQIEVDQQAIKAARAQCHALFQAHGHLDGDKPSSEEGDWAAWSAWISMLMMIPVFHHLWFLWFLCWLVAGFSLLAWGLKGRFKSKFAQRVALSPWRMLWLVPLTWIPQSFMGQMFPVFGPDTAVGLIPVPSILAYYAIFFGYGVLYFLAKDSEGNVGKGWVWGLPLTLALVLPAGLLFTHSPGSIDAPIPSKWISDGLKVIFAWSMCFGLMGLFRRYMATENRKVRYVSDASYWLYLMHLPLVILAQWMLRDLTWPSLIKFTVICVTVTGCLMLCYALFVRYTWVGRLLNGPKKRPSVA